MPELIRYRTRRHRARPRRHWERWLAAVLALLILAGLTANYFRPLPMVTAAIAPLPQLTARTVDVQWPSAGQAAIGATGYGVLDAHNDATPAATASIAKLITALCVLQKYPLNAGEQGPTITLNSTDVDIYDNYVARDGSVVAVQAGEQLTEYQILQGMLLPSANNLADSLAIWAFGSLEQYRTYASQFLAQNGMQQTHIGSDASGYSTDTTATASDLVRLGLLVLGQPALTEIAAQPSADLPVAGTVYNYNSMLGKDGITGLKTGNNDADPGAFLFSATISVGSSKLPVVGVIMNQPSLNAALRAAQPLVASLQAGFEQKTLVTANQQVGTYHVPWSNSVPAVAKRNLQLNHWKPVPGKVQVHLNSIVAGEPRGEPVGSLILTTIHARTADTIVLGQPLPQPSFWWRLTRH